MPINPPRKVARSEPTVAFVRRNAILVAFLLGQASGVILSLLLGGVS